jgi:hypothetical protein
MSDEVVSKAAVSVTEMARAVGLSRARFYQLVRRGTFPPPDSEPVTGRPCYFEDGQRRCLEVRRRNCGIDGKPILFYSRRRDFGAGKRKPPKPKLEQVGKDVASLVDGLNALGLTTATAAQVEQVARDLYPQGTAGIDQGVVLKAVFLEIRRRYSSGSEDGK